MAAVVMAVVSRLCDVLCCCCELAWLSGNFKLYYATCLNTFIKAVVDNEVFISCIKDKWIHSTRLSFVSGDAHEMSAPWRRSSFWENASQSRFLFK